MIVRPYIRPGNMVLYSPEGRDDVQISVKVDQVVRAGRGAFIEYADKTLELVDVTRLSPMPAARMKPVASIRQSLDEVIAEYEANDGDINALARLKRKHGIR
jgi:hypothetical protein